MLHFLEYRLQTKDIRTSLTTNRRGEPEYRVEVKGAPEIGEAMKRAKFRLLEKIGFELAGGTEDYFLNLTTVYFTKRG